MQTVDILSLQLNKLLSFNHPLASVLILNLLTNLLNLDVILSLIVLKRLVLAVVNFLHYAKAQCLDLDQESCGSILLQLADAGWFGFGLVMMGRHECLLALRILISFSILVVTYSTENSPSGKLS